jgi:DNA-binding response OmpR family regulator
VGVATVTLVGEGDLARAAQFLQLGAVVVIAPDGDALTAWMRERWGVDAADGEPRGEMATVTRLHVDHRAHCIRADGRRLALTELEFRVLGCLVAEPGRAWSYRELREAGWGSVPDLGDDPYVVRSVIQRVRRKLAAAAVDVRIEPVRGFGLRLVGNDVPPVRLAPPGAAHTA